MTNRLSTPALLWVLGWATTSAAYESGGPLTLGPDPGATDYYRITCGSGATDHLRFNLTDTTAAPAGSPALGVSVTKGSVRAQMPALTPGRTQTLSVPGGNGRYKVSVKSLAGGPTAPKTQNFTLSFQCLNATGQPTRTAPLEKSDKVARKATKTYAVNCANGAATGATTRLSVRAGNTTRDGHVLMAQVLLGQSAVNATEGNEIAIPRPGSGQGSGAYYVTVDSTGTVAGDANVKQYAFSARCVTATGEDSGEALVESLQDQ